MGSSYIRQVIMILVLPSLIRDTEFTTADKSVDTEHTHESGHTQARTDDR